MKFTTSVLGESRVITRNGHRESCHEYRTCQVVMTTVGVEPQTHGAHGSFVAALPRTTLTRRSCRPSRAPASAGGRAPARTGRFTFRQSLSDGAGTYLSTFHLAADIDVVRDAANTVTFDLVN